VDKLHNHLYNGNDVLDLPIVCHLAVCALQSCWGATEFALRHSAFRMRQRVYF